MNSLTITFFSLSIIFIIIGAFFYWRSFSKSMIKLQKREADVKRKMYELAILKEIGDRIGYSLDVQKIIDIITGSLNQFIEYSAVSYMFLEPEKILFKIHLERSVSRKFIDEIQGRMLRSLSALVGKEFTKNQVEEALSGSILVEELEEPVRSFFNIPLVISGKIVGVLTVAHTVDGLYKEEEMTILYKLTKQASQAVTRLQEVVRTEQRKLNAMVESMNEGVVMTDNDYRVVVVNPVALNIIGVKKDVEVTIFDFINKLQKSFDIRSKLEESIKLDKILYEDEVLIGESFYKIVVSPVKSSLGINKTEIMGGVVIFHNITKEKEVEKMRDDFISMMVHELRSPLDGVKKMTELMNMVKSKKVDKSFAENIEIIHRTSSDMLELVNDLLDVAKIESGKFELFIEPADIAKVIKDRVVFYGPLAKESDIKLSAKVGKNIPKEFDFDSLRIGQVLNNLISNAIKFTREKGEVVVSAIYHQQGQDISAEAKDASVEWFIKKDDKSLLDLPNSIIVGVTDSGIGISAEDFSKLFNKFKQFKAVSVNGKHKGTGLGLSIVKGIVGTHKGIVGAASEEEKGSTFYFTLPIVSKDI
jgi:signal transduction histidine kinase/PAS domain-containing protein